MTNMQMRSQQGRSQQARKAGSSNTQGQPQNGAQNGQSQQGGSPSNPLAKLFNPQDPIGSLDKLVNIMKILG